MNNSSTEMDKNEEVQKKVIKMLMDRFQNNTINVQIPPPIFISMKAQIIAFDNEAGSMTVKFPILEDHLNPFGNVQGGMVAAAIDNTLGPLSMLIAPLNFTRLFEVKYRQIIKQNYGHMVVTGYFLEQIKRQLFFSADVKDPSGTILATAKSTHWIVEEN